MPLMLELACSAACRSDTAVATSWLSLIFCTTLMPEPAHCSKPATRCWVLAAVHEPLMATTSPEPMAWVIALPAPEPAPRGRGLGRGPRAADGDHFAGADGLGHRLARVAARGRVGGPDVELG